MSYPVTLQINGTQYKASVDATTTLLTLLREQFRFTGTKLTCGTGDCGSCTVIFDGRPVTSCMLPALVANGRQVLTIEGLAANGLLHPVQRTFIEHGAAQCGYCTPGMIMMAKALLDENPNPSEGEIRSALAGNLCRCTGYNKIIDAILAVATGR